jgi:hypothetical protein
MDESLRREFWVLTLARKRIVICRGELRLDSESGLASFVMDGRELSVEAGDVPAQVRRRRPSEPGHQDVDDVEVLLSKDAFLRGINARSRRRAKGVKASASFNTGSKKTAAAAATKVTQKVTNPPVATKAPTRAPTKAPTKAATG